MNLRNMFERHLVEVPRTSHYFVLQTSRKQVLYTSRGRSHLEQLNICFSFKSKEQIHTARTIAFKIQFLSLNHKLLYWTYESPKKVPCRSQPQVPLGNLYGTSPGRRVLAGLNRNTFNKIMKQDLKWYPYQIFIPHDEK